MTSYWNEPGNEHFKQTIGRGGVISPDAMIKVVSNIIDVPNMSASLLDTVSLPQGDTIFRGLVAGSGITINTQNLPDGSGSFIVLESTGGSGGSGGSTGVREREWWPEWRQLNASPSGPGPYRPAAGRCRPRHL